MARKLLDGKFHEEEDDEEDILTYKIGKENLNKAFKVEALNELERKNRFEEFESQVHKVF